METIRKIISQNNINHFYHLPKAIYANTIFGFPGKKLKVIGVTGTDGKTTTVNMIYQILKSAGKKVSMVSTVNAVIAGKEYDTGFHVTSPDPLAIQKFTQRALKNGDEYLVLEVTSHALDQLRFWGIKFKVGVITNITHEHLDYHKTFENYLKTKLSLLKNIEYAIVNTNLKPFMKDLNISRLLTFGLKEGDFNNKDINLKLKLPGNYNIENALAALGVAFVLGIDRKVAQKTLENFTPVKGRMQEIKNKRGIRVVVDFAHTPNALEQVLGTLRLSAEGRLIALFGSAGKRDIKKRELMGEVGKKMADFVIVAPEDPRGELVLINQQIQKGIEKAGGILNRSFFVINDREEAINFAINSLSRRGDTIGIFGKGHEKSLNLDGKTELPWSDQEAVEKVLSNG